jgi:hypothetical protein
MKPPLYFTIKEMKSVLAEMDDQGWCELEPLGLETWMGRINAFTSGERSRPAQVIRIPVFEGADSTSVRKKLGKLL